MADNSVTLVGNITREPNIIVWLNTTEALNGSQFGPSNVRDGDLIRVEASDIKRFEELPGGVTVQVKNATRTFANLSGRRGQWSRDPGRRSRPAAPAPARSRRRCPRRTPGSGSPRPARRR